MRFIVLLLFLAGFYGVQAGEALLPQFPIPAQKQSLGYSVALPEAKSGAIVVAGKAAEPVHYAAERLQASLARLTGLHYPIVDSVPADCSLAIVLEEKGGSVDSLDGYAIQFEKGAPQVVRVIGDNPRSTIYGQEALLALIQKADKDKSDFLLAENVYDQARLKIRSFAQNRCEAYSAGNLDAYVDARLNCIELRDGPPKGMNGQFGYPATWEIPLEPAREVMKEANRRGMYVYGVVCCGVKDEDADKVLAHYETLLSLGVHGIYISFDDPGLEGNAAALVSRILDLAEKHKISPDNIVFLPPSPDYGLVATKFNREMLTKVPRLADVRWVFTSPPSDVSRFLVGKLQLHRPYGWWYNWPMGNSVEVLPIYWGERSYICVPDFTDLSSDPNPTDGMREAPKLIDSAMVWVRGYPEYLAQLFGSWAWDPETFDADLAKKRIYSRLYGIDQVADAKLFDDLFSRVKSHMTRIGQFNWNQCVWRPQSTDSREWMCEMLDEMERLHKKLEANAPRHTLVNRETLRDYLDPMQKAIVWCRMLATTTFPEQVKEYFDRDLDWERKHGREKIYLDHWRKRFEPLLVEIQKKFGKSPYTRKYVNDWRKKLTPSDQKQK